MMCEECWRDAGLQAMLTGRSKVDIYEKLVAERDNDPEHVKRVLDAQASASVQSEDNLKD